MLELNKIYQGDCLELINDLPPIDFILTDPPYPDYYIDEYKYYDGLLDFLKGFDCRQFIFWTSKIDFPLDYTAIHIWDKKTGCGSEYERIFERNGHKNFKVFRYYLINSTVAAKYTKDIFTGHKSQKPIGLITELVEKFTKENDLILDPFVGSGTTAIACIKTNRNYMGIELNKEYVDIANKRIADYKQQLTLV